MKRKIIRKRQNSGYKNSYRPWNLIDDISNFMKDSLHGYIRFIREYGKDIEDHIFIPDDLGEFEPDNAEKRRDVWLSMVEKMYYSFNEVALDYPDSPYSIWYNDNKDKIKITAFKEDGFYKSRFDGPEFPEEEKEKTKEYNQKICEGIMLYAKYAKDVSSFEYTYDAAIQTFYGKKQRKRQFDKINAFNVKEAIFCCQAKYIAEGLDAFRNSHLYGVPDEDMSIKEWKDIINAMYFSFNEISKGYSKYEKHDSRYMNRLQHGCDLFGKYFLSLWD